MPRRAALVSSASHGVPTRPSSPKSDAKRSSAGGHADASAEPATAAMRTRVSSTTASPRRASSATSSVGELRARSAPRTERGRWLAGAERIPRSSMTARVRHAVSASRNAERRRRQPPRHHELRMPVAQHGAQRLQPRDLEPAAAGQLRHGEEARHRLRRPPPLGHAGRQAEEREVERGVDVEARPRGRSQRAGAEPGRLEGAHGGVVGRAALEGLQRPVEVAGHDEGVGARSGCCQPPRPRSGSRGGRAPGRPTSASEPAPA